LDVFSGKHIASIEEPQMKTSTIFLTTALVVGMAGSVAAQDKAKQGETIFKRTCGACHTVEPGKNRIGPSLAGVVGRKAGTEQGFKYSDAMAKAGVTWSDESLNKYLSDPKAFIPGNKMAFAGLKKDDERAAVIDYLEHVKAGG
jgi:cytochrome c